TCGRASKGGAAAGGSRSRIAARRTHARAARRAARRRARRWRRVLFDEFTFELEEPHPVSSACRSYGVEASGALWMRMANSVCALPYELAFISNGSHVPCCRSRKFPSLRPNLRLDVRHVER